MLDHPTAALPRYFRERIVVDAHGCWLWTLALNNKGYGTADVANKRVMAHRAVYAAVHGPIAPGLVLDHSCKVRHCVNPDHLEPCTQRENVLRGARGRAVTACVHGHEYTPENTIWRGPDGQKRRRCRECHNARKRVAA